MKANYKFLCIWFCLVVQWVSKLLIVVNFGLHLVTLSSPSVRIGRIMTDWGSKEFLDIFLYLCFGGSTDHLVYRFAIFDEE